jgi:hypothetical protein
MVIVQRVLGVIINCLSPKSLVWSRCVMPVIVPRVINCHFLDLPVCQRLLLSLCFLMCGGAAPNSIGNNKYYVSFIDDYSKLTWIFLLENKSEAFSKFCMSEHVEHLLNRKIIVMQTDWGGEYERLNSFFTSIGISHLVSFPHTHQHNGATPTPSHRRSWSFTSFTCKHVP